MNGIYYEHHKNKRKWKNCKVKSATEEEKIKLLQELNHRVVLADSIWLARFPNLKYFT